MPRRIIACVVLAAVLAMHGYGAWLFLAPDPIPVERAQAALQTLQKAQAVSGALTREAVERILDQEPPHETGGGSEHDWYSWRGRHLSVTLLVDYPRHNWRTGPPSNPGALHPSQDAVVTSMRILQPSRRFLRELPATVVHPWGEGLAGSVLVVCALSGLLPALRRDRRALAWLFLPGTAWLAFAVGIDSFLRGSEFNVLAIPPILVGLYLATVGGLVACSVCLWRITTKAGTT